jgi:Raf kinase inhibitor-like YbhB/YbcL family protein
MFQKNNLKRYAVPALIILATLAAAYYRTNRKQKEESIQVSSPAFENGEFIPQKYTADGEEQSPPLLIKNVPEAAKSLVLIMDDPDAPTGTFTHWLAWNIDPKTELIAENSLLGGAMLGTNSAHKLNYVGPRPPSGTHRYFFKVYALNKILDLPRGSSKEDLQKAMQNNVLARGSLMGKYSKQ